ncbi:hypothetical protein MTY59_12100 [Mycobacterium senriense]|uniref:Uncharacterized protein n=2 Tax=Mycobacterium senriense TaxID=2775496 RepID=A0ABM7SJR1_9MYCO|nr:hypothetical protein MTY59_12100 [Mycobacterium senriense]
MPANAAAILGVLAMIPGFWILRVEGWKETLSIDIATGHTSSTSTFSSQLARAAVYFVIGAALLLVAKVLADKQTPWPPAVQQLMERLGLAPYSSRSPSPMANGILSERPHGLRRFNTPPNWPPTPAGWAPGPGWEPDPSWPPAPPGWQFWIDDSSTHAEPGHSADIAPVKVRRKTARVKLVIGACALIAVLLGVYVWATRGVSDHQVERALKARSQTAYLFKSDGRPRFHITSSTEPEPGWYVVKLKLDDVDTEEGTVVLQQRQGSSDKQLNVIAGPGTAFPNECASYVFPAAVHKMICGS